MTGAPRLDRQGRERGIALVVVLWIVATLALLVSAFNASLRTSLRVEGAELEAARRRALMWAGVEIAAARIADPDPLAKWEASDIERTVAFAGTELRVRISDHAGRVDLNLADEKLIRGLMQQAAGSDQRVADSITDRILDWRDADRERRSSGAEAADYRGAGLAFGPADGDFQSPQQLVRVLGIDYRTAQRLLPLITVYSRAGKLNPAVASREVLAAIPGITPDLLTQIMLMRGAPAGGGLQGLLQPYQQYLDEQQGPVYSIEVTQQRPGAEQASRLEVIILSGGGGTSPYRVLGFQEPPPVTEAR